jgi:hypothetical protein
VEVIFEAELGQSALKVGYDPECNVVILNLSMWSPSLWRSPFYLYRRDL